MKTFLLNIPNSLKLRDQQLVKHNTLNMKRFFIFSVVMTLSCFIGSAQTIIINGDVNLGNSNVTVGNNNSTSNTANSTVNSGNSNNASSSRYRTNDSSATANAGNATIEGSFTEKISALGRITGESPLNYRFRHDGKVYLYKGSVAWRQGTYVITALSRTLVVNIKWDNGDKEEFSVARFGKTFTYMGKDFSGNFGIHVYD